MVLLAARSCCDAVKLLTACVLCVPCHAYDVIWCIGIAHACFLASIHVILGRGWVLRAVWIAGSNLDS